MLQYIIAGLVVGGICAISSAGLIVTYVSIAVVGPVFTLLMYHLLLRRVAWQDRADTAVGDLLEHYLGGGPAADDVTSAARG